MVFLSSCGSILLQKFGGTRKWERKRMIDLFGLHVSKAIRFPKHELAIIRIVTWSADQCLLVYICVNRGGKMIEQFVNSTR